MNKTILMETKSNISKGTILRGTIFALIITCILFFLLAFLISATSMNEEIVPTLVFGISIISLVFGGMIASRTASKSGFLHGALVAMLYFGIIFIGSMILNKGIQNPMRIFVMALGCLGAGMFGGIIGINLKRKRRR